MLKKARSFKEDFKGLIKRRPSTSGSSGGKPRIQVNGEHGRAKDDVSTCIYGGQTLQLFADHRHIEKHCIKLDVLSEHKPCVISFM